MDTQYFSKVKEYVYDLGLSILKEDTEEHLLVVSHEAEGINQLVIDCEDGILVIEQFILELNNVSTEALVRLLQINREIVHGALALDESGKKVIFRDTLQLENLDYNELEASVNALSLMLAEHAEELIKFAKR